MTPPAPVFIVHHARTGMVALNVITAAIGADPRTAGVPVRFVKTREETAAAVDEASRAGALPVVGWSFYSTDFPAAAAALAWVKENARGAALHVAGGVHATAEPLATLRAGFDLCALGEGEATAVALFATLLTGGDPRSLRGLAHLGAAGELVSRGPGDRAALDAYPAFNLRHRKFNAIEITRGCVYACSFCQTPFVFKARFRHRSVADVAAHVAVLRREHLPYVRFVTPTALSYGSEDESVNLDAVEALLAGVREAYGPEGRVYFGTFPSEVRPEHVTEQSLAILQRWVDNDNLVIGAQSGSQRVLDATRRGHTALDVVRAVRLTLAAGFVPNVDFLLGLPGETLENRAASLRLAEELVAMGARIHGHAFLPLPGTPLRDAVPEPIDAASAQRMARLESRGALYGQWRQQVVAAEDLDAAAARRVIGSLFGARGAGRRSDMERVDLSKLIVSYQGIEKRLAGGLEAVSAESTSGATDDIEKAAFVAGLEQAQIEIVEHTKVPTVFAVPDHAMSSLLLSYLADEARRTGKVVPAPSGYEAKFDDKDIGGWIKSFFTWWRALKKADFVPSVPAAAQAASNDLRIAVLGDWGTNLYGAPVCAASIQSAAPAYDMVLHLGDVYYSGMVDECQTRLLAPWPQIPGAINRALNANHEMYTGGHGYFEKILPAFRQASSYFAIKTDYFLLVGLDTAYDEHDLAGDQAAWLEQAVADAGDRKVILFSHHQPYSVFEKQGDKLLSKLQSLFDAQRVFAWYWGHEHRCMLYERGGLGFWGRCIGHSGYPYFRQDMKGYALYKTPGYGVSWYSIAETDHTPVAHILDGPNPYVTEAPAEYGAQGYATLELRGPELHEYVHLPDGSVIYERQLA